MTAETTADFLVELGTEELPPKALLRLRDAFRNGIESGLEDARLSHGEIKAYATPRRLAVSVAKLELRQPEQTAEFRGPPVGIAYDDSGNPTKAAKAFAAKCGVSIDQLSTTKSAKGEWLYYQGSTPGRAASELLGDIVSASIAALPIPKRMRWGDSDVEFVRPVHWLLMLLGSKVVDAVVLGIHADRQTFGHRFHAPEAISLSTAGDYVNALEDQGHVIVDFERRKNMIVEAATKAATDNNGEAILHPDVVDEVAALVEWPVPVVGRFDAKFLELPPEVLISTLQDHQRYFPVEKQGNLMPMFVTISNIESTSPDEVRRGNERVVLPRLADAAFFWDQDTAVSLASRRGSLNEVVYQKGLGSLQDKASRVEQLAGLIALSLQTDSAPVSRAAQLARADLLTEMVGEFPELQGRMGYYYALNDDEPETVAVAIEEQYLPRHAGDRIPATPAGQALGIADRLDTLAGIFALGKRPTGNKDPFGLRRQALGLVRILIESEIDIDLPALLATAVELQPVEKIDPATATDLYQFIMERMRAWYLAGQAPDLAPGEVSSEMFEAVLIRAPASPFDFHQRLLAVQRFMSLEEAASLAAANKRISNILKKGAAGTQKDVQTAIFEAAEETALFEAVSSIVPGHKEDLQARDYEGALRRLADLKEPVDGYFDNVMVMSDDDSQRANRIAQLEQLRELFLDVADISCIPTNN